MARSKMGAKKPSEKQSSSAPVGLLKFFKPIGRDVASAHINPASEPPLGSSGPVDTAPANKHESTLDAVVKTADTIESQSSESEDEEQSAAQSGVSEYERKRLARIAMNSAFLQQLGVSRNRQALQHVKPQAVAKAKPRKREWSELRSDSGEPVTRRSSRLRGMQATSLETSTQREERVTVQEDQVVYRDSNVFKYACDSAAYPASQPTPVKLSQSQPLVGFLATSSTFADPMLRKIYAIAFSPFPENTLIAATGHNGHISIYAANGLSIDGNPAPPLMSFRGHRGWISSLSLSRSSLREKSLLLSAANDGIVKLWDLNQSDGATAKELLSISHLHRSGIFGMDVHGESVLTCSKDSTIALSTLRQDNSDLQFTRRFEEHAGVVKCVEFSRVNASLFASGGNDCKVRVFDTRVNGSGIVCSIADAHTRAINCVTWHPTDENLVLSASFEPTMHLFDRRRPASPVVSFHNPSSVQGSPSIYHPRFVGGGEYIVSTGPTTQDHLNLYRVTDGSTVSRGILAGSASYVVSDPFADRLIVAIGPQLQYFDYKRQSASLES